MVMLPILDISPYLADRTGIKARQFIHALIDTCHDPGFFYLIGHGGNPQIDGDMLDVANRFFALPLAERESLAIGHSKHFRGYTLLENERTAGQIDWRDQIDIGPEEPALELNSDDPPWLRLRGPNQWPPNLPSMPEVVTTWMQHLQPIGMALMQALAQGLGQTADYFDDRMSPDPYTRVKIIRYPAQPYQGGSGQGLGLHHDSGIITFILQDQVSGLQVMHGDTLVDVEPIPGAYVVNLGEMMQTATNGYLRATPHQVVSPPSGRQRISIAYFMNPRLDAKFEPIALPFELAEKASGGQNVNASDRVYETFGLNTLKIRMRSHADVTAAYYADVKLDDLA